MPVPSVGSGGAAVTASIEPRRRENGSFAGELAHASKRKQRLGDVPDRVLDSKTVPEGEKTKPVAGHAYSDVVSGPRNGMYVNTSGNERDGMAFVLVKRNGREYHIYGSGKDRLVVCLKRKPEADATPKTPETTAPVTDTQPTGGASAARL